jgi:hypothetical protein
LRFEHYDLAIGEVSHCGFLRGHSSISELKDPTVGFKKRIYKKLKMNLAWFKKGHFEAILSLKSSKNFRG